MNDTPQLWLLARSSGLFAYVALSLGVVSGLTLHTRLLGRAVPPAVITAIHQVLSTVGLLATALHIGLLVVDTHADIPLLGAFVPGLVGHQVLATALGVIAFELWLCVHLSFYARKWIGVKRWRKMHAVTFGTWGLAALHGITAGSDSGLGWVQNIYTVSIGLVAALIAYRALVHGGQADVRHARSAPQAVDSTPTSTPITH